MSDEENYDEAVKRVHECVQGLVAEGLLPGDMLTHWHFVGTALDMDHEPGEADSVSILMCDSTAILPVTLGMVRAAEILLEKEVEEWYGAS